MYGRDGEGDVRKAVEHVDLKTTTDESVTAFSTEIACSLVSWTFSISFGLVKIACSLVSWTFNIGFGLVKIACSLVSWTFNISFG